jgi:Domain of unknown function (DUF4332)
VSDIASLEEVRGWRQMAALLEVREATTQWAEALVESGVRTLAALHEDRLDELQAIFDRAKADGKIPDVPTQVQMAEMLKDAALLDAQGSGDRHGARPRGLADRGRARDRGGSDGRDGSPRPLFA